MSAVQLTATSSPPALSADGIVFESDGVATFDVSSYLVNGDVWDFLYVTKTGRRPRLQGGWRLLDIQTVGQKRYRAVFAKYRGDAP